MRLIEWEVAEDGYEEQVVIPKEKRDLAAKEFTHSPNPDFGRVKNTYGVGANQSIG